MFLKESTEERKVQENHRWGKPVLRTRRKTVYHLKCDECGQEFTRCKGEMDKNRLSNECRHFCPECFDYGKVAKMGTDAYIRHLEERIGQKFVDSEGREQLTETNIMLVTLPMTASYCICIGRA